MRPLKASLVELVQFVRDISWHRYGFDRQKSRVKTRVLDHQIEVTRIRDLSVDASLRCHSDRVTLRLPSREEDVLQILEGEGPRLRVRVKGDS